MKSMQLSLTAIICMLIILQEQETRNVFGFLDPLLKLWLYLLTKKRKANWPITFSLKSIVTNLTENTRTVLKL